MQHEPQFVEIGQDSKRQASKRRRIAYRFDEGQDASSPAVFWLSGFLSDMASTKVSALSAWAKHEGHAMLCFDYSGHGVSGGDILKASVGDWLEEAATMLELLKGRRVILVGSSLGGWIGLLLARALAKSGDARLGGLVLIAPAWDMTEKLMWEKMSKKTRVIVETEGVFYAPSDYDDPYPLTKVLIQEGRNHLLAAGGIEVGCPVRILQGLRDEDVPWQHALAIVDLIEGDDVEITLVKDGNHRLSSPEDLRRLTRTVGALIETAASPSA